jgi:uncharacterized protein (TIGR01619 family)
MSDQWNFYALLVDGEPASIFVDLGIAKEAPIADFPNMAYLRIRMNNPRPDGLSSQEEYKELIGLEDEVTSAIERSGNSIYVGRNTSGGNRDFYFYTKDAGIGDVAVSAMAQWPGYEFETGARSDAEWSVYWDFLYPSPKDLELIANREVINRLRDNGDRIDIARKIDHLAVFRTCHGRDDFARYIVAKGYDVSQTKEVDGEFLIEFDRIDRPDKIDDVTIDLFKAARDNGGEYDGWGCPTAD